MMRNFKIKIRISLLALLLLMFQISMFGQNNPRTLVLTTEKALADNQFAEVIEDFYNTGIDGYFKGKNDVAIYFNTFLQPQSPSPAIVISSGRTEAAIKYKELIFDLYKNGYSVYIFDHRGQGQSGRMAEDHDMGYVEDFQFYIDDMRTFYLDYVAPMDHSKYFLLAHSMGGAIGMSYLEQFPTDFDAAAFSSPMLGLKFGTCGGAKLLEPKKTSYGLGQGKYKEKDQVFKHNTLTGSEIRYNRMVEAFNLVPEARLGGATYQWAVESCDQFKYMNSHLGEIQTPFLLFSAENEQIVSSKSHKEFVKNAKDLGKECEYVFIENAQHELLIEKDPQRQEVLERIHIFFNR